MNLNIKISDIENRQLNVISKSRMISKQSFVREAINHAIRKASNKTKPIIQVKTK